MSFPENAPKKVQSFIDTIDSLVVALWEKEQFRNYLQAVHNAETVEGTIAIDDVCAARMIRDEARATGVEEIASENLQHIVSALNTVLRRYNLSRKQRRDSAKFNMGDESDNVLGLTDESGDEHD